MTMYSALVVVYTVYCALQIVRLKPSFNYPSSQPVNSGAFFDTRVDGPSWRVSKNAPEVTSRELRPWTRAANSGSGTGLYITLHYMSYESEIMHTRNAWFSRASFEGGDDQTPRAWASPTFSWLLLFIRKNLASRKMYRSSFSVLLISRRLGSEGRLWLLRDFSERLPSSDKFRTVPLHIFMLINLCFINYHFWGWYKYNISMDTYNVTILMAIFQVYLA